MPKAQSSKAVAKSDNRKMAEQIYDMIMADIEPDLLLANIPGLDSKYAHESPEEHKERMKNYKRAYKEFDSKLAEFMGKIKKETRDSKREVMKTKEQKERHAEEAAMQNLEQAFS